jgi:hypothetical protein
LAFISIVQPALAESKSKSANVITIDASRLVLAPESGGKIHRIDISPEYEVIVQIGTREVK